MASDQQFCLRWNNHQSTLISVFDTLLENEKLVDCTLAADGQYLKAHKVVLSACSPYLEAMLSQHFDQHPILILKDVKYQELKAMLDYMYRGEVNISEEQLVHFLKAAESLQIKGLSDRGGGGSSVGGGSESGNEQSKRHEPRKPPTHVPHLPARTVVPHPGHGSEQKKPHPHDLNRLSQPKSPMTSQDECGSPAAKKRRRPMRPSSTDSNIFTSTAIHYPESYSEGNSSDVPSGNVPITSTPTPATISKAPPDAERNEPDSYLGQTGATKPDIKTEVPHTLVQPKTEYVDYENDDSVEDQTLDEDDEGEDNLSRPGPSFASGSPGIAPWQLSADGSNDEMFLAAQEGGGANQNSQGTIWRQHLKSIQYPFNNGRPFADWIRPPDKGFQIPENGFQQPDKSLQTDIFPCLKCGKNYNRKGNLVRHVRYECGKSPQFQCEYCKKSFFRREKMEYHSQLHIQGRI